MNAHEAHAGGCGGNPAAAHLQFYRFLPPLKSHPALGVRHVESASGWVRGSDHASRTESSYGGSWLDAPGSGLEAAVRKLAAAGTPVLGQTLRDPGGRGRQARCRAWVFLPCETEFTPSKARACTAGKGANRACRGAAVEGYETHMGRTKRLAGPAAVPAGKGGRGCDAGQCVRTLFW